MKKFLEWIKESDWTYDELGQELGTSRNTIYRYAKGVRTPDDRTKVKIELVTKGDFPVSAWFEAYREEEEALR